MPRTVLLAAITIAPLLTALQPPPAPPVAPSLPDTEIFLATLDTARPGAMVGRPTNITNSPGYDNQPSFTPDGASVLFTSIRGGTQTDIYRYDLSSASIARVTNTPESEYSPMVTPDGAHISVVRVEPNGTQRLWRFTLDGRQPDVVLERVKPVGYYAWVDDHTVALFVLGQPATLQIGHTLKGNAEEVARGINRSVQRIPRSGTISFVSPDPSTSSGSPRARSRGDEDGSLMVREFDPTTKAITTLASAVAGAKEADLTWAPNGMLMMAEKDVLYGWRRDDARWRRLADLAALGLHGVSRIAISPKGDRIAFVAQAQPR